MVGLQPYSCPTYLVFYLIITLVANGNIVDNVVHFFLHGVSSVSIMVVPYDVLVLTEVFRVSSSSGVEVEPFNLHVVQIAVDAAWSFSEPAFSATPTLLKNILSGGRSFSGLRLYGFFSSPYRLLV